MENRRYWFSRVDIPHGIYAAKQYMESELKRKAMGGFTAPLFIELTPEEAEIKLSGTADQIADLRHAIAVDVAKQMGGTVEDGDMGLLRGYWAGN
ncbi:MAG: hypothetical protein KKD44_25960 [Proteobacteria bacterium]|nr:hypothetical protein [Pseudomonadota bacterium]